jgi:glycosyltransferase involved in cell wall biosynthesis
LLKARYPQATLTVAGVGSEEQQLRALAASLATGGIRFVGRVEPEVMPELYDQSDIFVNASVLDNQPVSVLEAFAAGLPVVSTASGDLANMIRDAETGRIVPPEDPQAMADAVAGLLQDPARARSMARRARREAEKYTWPEVRGQWRDAYLGTGSHGKTESIA